MADEATILINADGTYADASPSALTPLGVELREFLGMAPGSFSPESPDPEADRAFREAWEQSGSPDLGGEATILRGDGTKARVRFMIMPGAGGHRVPARAVPATLRGQATVRTNDQLGHPSPATPHDLTPVPPSR